MAVSDVDADRAPICPACGVTMLIDDSADGEEARFVCLECGFSDDPSVSPPE
jgi:predicted RNA-binding Zn-ribbon protein involved in translation (DUF1610 family)